jgi:hypothetical protein
MRRIFDLQAIVYGFAACVIGELLIGVLGLSILNSGDASATDTASVFVQISGTIVPAAAGFVSAYNANSRRIMNGTIGGLLGVVLLISFAASVIPAYPLWGIPFLFVVFTLIASLGAIVGSYWRGKRGT